MTNQRLPAGLASKGFQGRAFFGNLRSMAALRRQTSGVQMFLSNESARALRQAAFFIVSVAVGSGIAYAIDRNFDTSAMTIGAVIGSLLTLAAGAIVVLLIVTTVLWLIAPASRRTIQPPAQARQIRGSSGLDTAE